MKLSIAKKTKSFLTGIAMTILFSLSSITAFAASSTFALPVKYTNTSSAVTTSNVTLTLDSQSIKKGSTIKLTSIPADTAINKGYENVNFVEMDTQYNILNQAVYGDKGSAISKGSVSYKLKSNPALVLVIFGSRNDANNQSVYDAMYGVGSDGSVLDMVNGTVISASTSVSVNNLSMLENASVNNSEFNAKTYYENNVDLQTSIGADAQALYNHWVKYGKAEGRKAK